MMKDMRFIPLAVGALTLLGACASMGRPGGGPRDETPPVAVRSNPAEGERNVDRTSLSIYFDENVQLEDAFNKVVISPVQQEAAQISANGRRVTINLRDTLVPNTTYTIDFGDAIKDLNEGNVLDGYALAFSTGADLDTLAISGTVLEAATLEPAQGMMVAAYANVADSAIRTLRPDRIARTNQHGQFTIRNLAAGTYRVYALNDLNRDWHWDRSEDVAFIDYTITPTVEIIAVTDTLYDAAGADSLVTRQGRRLLPNDVLLTWFNEGYQAQYLKDYARPDRRRATITLGAPTDSLPRVVMVDGPRAGQPASEWALAAHSAHGDSLTLWFADPAVAATDSLRLAVSYMRPDSLEQMQWTTDTLRFTYRPPRMSKKEKERLDTVTPRLDVLRITLTGGSPREVYRPLTFTFSEPVASIDTAAWLLEQMVDTLWTAVPDMKIEPDPAVPLLGYYINVDWTPGGKYRLAVDSAAVTSIYGEHNGPLKQEMSIRSLDDYANLTINLAGADSTAMVTLLTGSDEPVRTVSAADGHAEFRYLNPGTYYARMFFDANADGLWSTGILDSIQPEEVAYYPKKIELKRNWDVTQTWDIYELPVDAQKPYAILKNKPKLKRGEKRPEDETDEDDEDTLSTPMRGSGRQPGRTSSIGGGGLKTSVDR